jgi:hypothetical protein
MVLLISSSINSIVGRASILGVIVSILVDISDIEFVVDEITYFG